MKISCTTHNAVNSILHFIFSKIVIGNIEYAKETKKLLRKLNEMTKAIGQYAFLAIMYTVHYSTVHTNKFCSRVNCQQCSSDRTEK